MASKLQYLFILGHMRSRSSLLSHILMNHPSIYGLGESNKKYLGKLDLIKMRLKTRLYHKILNPIPFTFVDQINHNVKTPNRDLLLNNGKLIVLVREPKSTFRSIQDLTATYYEKWSHSQIVEYYSNRLKYLLNITEELSSDRYLTIDADTLVEDVKCTLNRLSKFLELNQELSQTYQTYGFSGKHGDPSSQISQGRIKAQQDHEIKIYPSVIPQECFDLYHQLVSKYDGE